MNASERFDLIIVGAGAAGCVLAGRISADPAIRVLLIEAGEDLLPGREPPAVLDSWPVSASDPRFHWPGLVAEVGADCGGGRPRFSRHYLQGRGVGGTSNINGMIALRGTPADYDEWRDCGAAGWAWNDVLPYFRRLESDLDFDGPLHGRDGPIPIRRVPADELSPLSKAFGAALAARGNPFVADLNGDFRDGFGPLPMNNRPDRRVSASMAYLDAAARARPNLSILAGTVVERVEIQQGRASGVRVRSREGRMALSGKEIVLSAGALNSPAILMRSGIGPGSHLQELGIDVVRDVPGVGRRLMNHPEVTIAMHLPRASMQPVAQPSFGQSGWRYSSGLPGCPEADMLVLSIGKGSWHPLGQRVGALSVAVLKSYSCGSVRLRSADAAIEPHVRFNLLDDARDLERLVDGVRRSVEALADHRVAGIRNDVFLPNGKLVRSLSQPRVWNRIRARALLMALDGPPALRRHLLGGSRLEPAALASDVDAIRDLVRHRAQPVHHVSGTCRMGRSGAADAVVDSDCAVIGVEGLRVVDASIMPTIVRANTHLPVLMIAEKMAESIGSRLRGRGHYQG